MRDSVLGGSRERDPGLWQPTKINEVSCAFGILLASVFSDLEIHHAASRASQLVHSVLAILANCAFSALSSANLPANWSPNCLSWSPTFLLPPDSAYKMASINISPIRQVGGVKARSVP